MLAFRQRPLLVCGQHGGDGVSGHVDTLLSISDSLACEPSILRYHGLPQAAIAYPALTCVTLGYPRQPSPSFLSRVFASLHFHGFYFHGLYPECYRGSLCGPIDGTRPDRIEPIRRLVLLNTTLARESPAVHSTVINRTRSADRLHPKEYLEYLNKYRMIRGYDSQLGYCQRRPPGHRCALAVRCSVSAVFAHSEQQGGWVQRGCQWKLFRRTNLGGQHFVSRFILLFAGLSDYLPREDYYCPFPSQIQHFDLNFDLLTLCSSYSRLRKGTCIVMITFVV